MFTKSKLFNTISSFVLYTLAAAVLLVATSCNKTYEVKAASDSIGPNAEDLEVTDICKDTKSIPLNQWKEVLDSRDYFVTSVASEALKKRYSEK